MQLAAVKENIDKPYQVLIKINELNESINSFEKEDEEIKQVIGKRNQKLNLDDNVLKRVKSDKEKELLSNVEINPQIAEIWKRLGDFDYGPEIYELGEIEGRKIVDYGNGRIYFG